MNLTLIAVDTNILVYAHRPDSQFFRAANPLLTELAQGASAWAIPWPCIHEFYAVVTSQKSFVRPTPAAHALLQIEAWRESPSLRLIGETNTHLQSLVPLIRAATVTGQKIHDAKIAAICLQHGVRELWSADRDFSRFPQLKTRNPLAG